jgi:hypothetical protein
MAEPVSERPLTDCLVAQLVALQTRRVASAAALNLRPAGSSIDTEAMFGALAPRDACSLSVGLPDASPVKDPAADGLPIRGGRGGGQPMFVTAPVSLLTGFPSCGVRVAAIVPG